MNKVTKEQIENKIVRVEYRRLTDKITHCTITMKNGFQVTGESAVVDPKNYDRKIGMDIAFKNAFDKLWTVEGYLLQEKLHMKQEFEKKATPGYRINPDEAFNINTWSEHEKQRENEKFINDVMDFRKQYPLTPDQAFKDKYKLLGGFTFEQLVENAVLLTPKYKKELFDRLFPDAPSFAFDLCEGKVKVDPEVHVDERTNKTVLPVNGVKYWLDMEEAKAKEEFDKNLANGALSGNPFIVNKQPYGKEYPGYIAGHDPYQGGADFDIEKNGNDFNVLKKTGLIVNSTSGQSTLSFGGSVFENPALKGKPETEGGTKS